MRWFWTFSLSFVLFNSAILPSSVHAQGFDLQLGADSVETGFQLGGAKEPEVSATISPGDKPGVVLFELSITIPEGSNSYSQAKDFPKPTVITVDVPSGWKALDNGFQPTPKPKRAFDQVFQKEVEKLLGTTVFSRRYLAPQGTDISGASFSGKVDFLLCDKGSCTPKQKKFTTTFVQKKKVEAGSTLGSTSNPSETLQEVVDTVVASSATETPSASASIGEEAKKDLYAVETEGQVESLGYALPMAFLGGLLLNIMPCVLPVLAIKILSLVQQAGESRSRILTLNLSYTAGVMLVFLLLAIVSSAIGWGGQFQNRTYVILMSIIVFSMGLSLLGVFELPIPGLVPSANHHNEGLLAAFNTGIVATLLATPCTGPFMGVVMAYAASQPTAINFLIFGTMGLGMASPYVAAGFFPQVVNWLPKPGMWMVRFKQFSGFVLMGTVIWLMSSSLDATVHVPLLILLLGVALFLWMIGLSTASGNKMFGKPLVYASLVAAPLLAYGIYDIRTTRESTAEERVAEITGQKEQAPTDVDEMPWEPFSETRMVELREQGTPMLIDFTADWCGVCKSNEMWALNRKPTVEFVRENGIVPLVADYTQEDAEIRKWLERFGVQSVPLVVIFPSDKNEKATAISGPYTMNGIIERLEKAVGPTQTAQVPESERKSL